MPKEIKVKITFFTKIEPVKITQYNYESILAQGDISANLIKDLTQSPEEVSV